jgi:sterol desaturase/sphingolipid hydroxylase (fatty acid hydroxylase superfamily)
MLTRYTIVSGFFYALFKVKRFGFVKLQPSEPKRSAIVNEIKWSYISSVVFALAGAYIIEAVKLGGTRIYMDPLAYPLWYLPVSFVLFLLAHDTYFYWVHRLMHHPRLYRTMHKVHHDSVKPTSWAALSFHWTEAMLEAMIIPLFAFLIPIHLGILGLALLFMTVNGVLNHAGYEIYPKKWIDGFLGRHLITATHHDLHHKIFNYNFGLYFRWWDRWMKTDRW